MANPTFEFVFFDTKCKNRVSDFYLVTGKQFLIGTPCQT